MRFQPLQGHNLKTITALALGWFSTYFLFNFFIFLNLDRSTMAASFPAVAVLLPLTRIYKFKPIVLFFSFLVGFIAFNLDVSFLTLLQAIIAFSETMAIYYLLEYVEKNKVSYLVNRTLVALISCIFGLIIGIFSLVFNQDLFGDFYYSLALMGVIHIIASIGIAPFVYDIVWAIKRKALGQFLKIPWDILVLLFLISSVMLSKQSNIEYLFSILVSYGYISYRCEKVQLSLINFYFIILIALLDDQLWGPFIGASHVQSLFTGGISIITILLISFVFYEMKEVNFPKMGYLGFVVIVGIFFIISQQVNSSEARSYFKHLEDLKRKYEEELNGRFEFREKIVNSVVGFWSGSESINPDEWRRFGESIDTGDSMKGSYGIGIFFMDIEKGEIGTSNLFYEFNHPASKKMSLETIFYSIDSKFRGLSELDSDDGKSRLIRIQFEEDWSIILVRKISENEKRSFFVFEVIDLKTLIGDVCIKVGKELALDMFWGNKEPNEPFYQFDRTIPLSTNQIKSESLVSLGDLNLKIVYHVTTSFSSSAFSVFWRTSLLFSLILILFGKVLIEMIQSTQRLNTLARDLSVKLVQNSRQAALGEMAAGIGHEINNPLTVISLTAQKILAQIKKGDITTDGLTKDIEKLIKTSERISKIIKGLKSLARNSTDDPMVEILLAESINDGLEVCLERFRHHDVDLDVRLSSRSVVKGRSAQLAQVVINLLNNSFDAVVNQRADGQAPWVRIECFDQDNAVVVSVIDCGSGIPIEVREKIFQPFFTTKEVGKGTGIGLEISRRIIEEHGGSLRYDDESPNTRFLFSLPKVK